MDSEQQKAPMSSLFQIACAEANLDLIKKIVEHGICKPDVVSLKVAIDRKHYDLIQFLLESADHPLVLDRFEGWSSLLYYTLEHFVSDQNLIKFVVGTTISADVRDSDGNTLLHLLCKHRGTFIPEEYNCYQYVLNNKHQLPLHIACHSESNLQIIKFASSQLQINMINTKDVDGNAPLHLVCKTYNVYSNNITECLKYLVNERKCDVNIQNNLGELPIHVILKRREWPWFTYGKEREEIIEILTNDQSYIVNTQDSAGNTPLHNIACKVGDSNTVLYLVSHFNCDLNVINDDGCIPLHYVLSSNKLSLEVVLAVSNGCTLKYIQNKLGKTPLHIACENPEYHSMNKEKKILLLDAVSDKDGINTQDCNGNTPLHVACQKLSYSYNQEGVLDTIVYLTSNFECNLDLLNSDQCLPLHCALISCNSLELVKILSNKCTLMHMQNTSGMTPLHIACRNDYCDIVRFLVFEKQCFPSGFEQSSDIYDSLDIHLACKHESDFELLKALANEQNVNNILISDYGDDAITPAYIACGYGNHLALQMLLELKCDVKSKDSSERLLFHVACSRSLKCVKLLSPYITDDVMNTCDKYGNTPLHMALQKCSLDVVEYLSTTFHCDTSLKNNDGELPLHIACKTNVATVRLVVESSVLESVSMNCQTKCGDTPLHIACKAGALDIVIYLLESFDCDPSMTLRNNAKCLPIDYACKYSLELVKLVSQSCTMEDLVSRHYKSDMYVSNDVMKSLFYSIYESSTTLDVACMGGFLDIVKYLINDKGCCLSKLENNHSALGYACGLLPSDRPCTPWPDIVQFLIEKCGYNPGELIQNRSLYEYACQKNCLDLMKALTVQQLDHRSDKGNTPLHYACKYGCVDIVKYLTEHGCKQNTVNNEQELPLHIACRESLAVAELLKNCDVNFWNNHGDTPLHIACALMKEDIVLYLIKEMKCDINCQDQDGNTPLHIACFNDKYDMAQFLMSFPKCRTDILNNEGQLVLHVHLNNYLYFLYDQEPEYDTKWLQILEMLLERFRAAAGTSDNDGITPLDIAINTGNLEAFIPLYSVGEIDDTTRNSVLYTACEQGQSKIVRWLIDHGASTEVRDSNMNLPQHLCFRQVHHYTCLQTLKELGHVNVCEVDKNNDTILHLACKMASDDVLFYILKTFDDCRRTFSMQNNDKDTPLHILATKGVNSVSSQTLALIICENPNVKDKSGNTPLHLACQHNYIEFAEYLISICKRHPNMNDEEQLLANAKNVNKHRNYGGTGSPLHIACQAINVDGDTPLHIAAEESLELVKLVATPENINMQNVNGDTPLHIACREQKWNIVLYLLEELKCSAEILTLNSESAFHVLFSNWNSVYNVDHEMLDSVQSYIPKAFCDVPNKIGDSLLHITCRKSLNSAVKFLVNSLGCKIDIINECSGATPLHFACYSDSLTVVKLVSKCNPTAQITDVSYVPKGIHFVCGDTSLHIACRKGDVKMVRYLLRAGHSNALKCPNTLEELPIHLAAATKLNQKIPLIRCFLAHKKHFDSNAKTKIHGETPLHIICRKKPSAYCVHLLVKGLNCQVDQEDSDGNLPLHIVCQSQIVSQATLNVLTKTLSDDQLRHRNKKGNTALHEFFESEYDTHYSRYEIKYYFKSLRQLYVDRGLLPTDSNLLQYIHLACRHKNLSVVKYFWKKYVSRLQETPQSVLYEACLNYNNGVLRYVLNTFVFDVNVPNEVGDLPLHLAARMKICEESTILLLEKTKNINHKNFEGNTPLHELYSTSGSKTFYHAKMLLLHFLKIRNIDLSVQNVHGFTPLHCMCLAHKFNHLNIVIRRNKINANIPDDDGMTILHLACQANSIEAVELILKLTDADPSVENNLQQAPISITTDPDIIRLLTEYGANPQPLYDMHKAFFQRFSSEKPPPTPVKLLVIGHPSVGKTTLIQSLQNELSEVVISQNFDHTAGIVTTDFCSQFYGDVTFYDFAGQAEYYASHDAIIHSTIKNLPPIVLILVNMIQPTPEIIDQTYYWINFISKRCSGLSDQPAHLIIIGSHADILESRKKDPSKKASHLHQLVASQLDCEKKNVVLKGIIPLNCTRAQSNEMTSLHQLLQQSTDDLREKGVMNFNSHCFFVLLLQMFRNNNVVNLGHVLHTLKSESKDSKNSPLFALPSDRPKVIEMCYDLNEKGHIMFIEDPQVIDMSWLILDKAPLLKEILGTLFAPSNFPQHCPLSYSTGVVPVSHFENHFRTKLSYPSSLSLTFLSRLEYCREIKDNFVLKSILVEKEFSESERYYFFPNLVSLERPNDIWGDNFSYQCGWLIQCKREPDGESFNPHFIQALLLRLAFSFTPKKIADDSKTLDTYEDNSESELEEESQIKRVVIERLCSVWKNGIYWLEHSGVKTVVEFINPSTLVLLMQCVQPGCEMQLIKRRSSVILMVLNARDEFCGKAELREYFLHPSIVTHPLPSLKEIQTRLFSFQQVEKSITERNPCVINDQNEYVHLDDLLYFEPYSDMCKDVKIAKSSSTPHNEQFSIFQGRKLPQGIWLRYTITLVVFLIIIIAVINVIIFNLLLCRL